MCCLRIQCWKFHPAMVMNFSTLGCAISSSVADVWRPMSHCVKRWEEGCKKLDSCPATPAMVPVSQKNVWMCLRVMMCFVFFSLFFVFVVMFIVFQFQLVLLLWGIFSDWRILVLSLRVFFLKKWDSTVAGRALQSCTWPTRLEGAKVQGRMFCFFFETLEEGRIHVSFIHTKIDKVEV